jgi:hypothetical protein
VLQAGGTPHVVPGGLRERPLDVIPVHVDHAALDGPRRFEEVITRAREDVHERRADPHDQLALFFLLQRRCPFRLTFNFDVPVKSHPLRRLRKKAKVKARKSRGARRT